MLIDVRTTKFGDVRMVALCFVVMDTLKLINMGNLGRVSKSPKFGVLLTLLGMLV